MGTGPFQLTYAIPGAMSLSWLGNSPFLLNFRGYRCYPSLSLCLGQAEELYQGVEGDSLRQEYKRMLEAVGQAARDTFERFEQAVKDRPVVDDAAAAGMGPGSAGLSGVVSGREKERFTKNGSFLGKLTK